MRAAFLPLSLLCGAFAVVGTATVRPARPEEDTLVGRVLADGRPVAGARVRLRTQPSFALSDPTGSFRLYAPRTAGSRVTASREGHLIAGAPADDRPLVLRLERLPPKDNEDYEWVDPAPDLARPGNCGNCHGEIYREWSATAHARSSTNPHFLDLLAGTGRHGRPAGWGLRGDRPEGAGVCNACHAPTASFDADLTEAAGVKGKDPSLTTRGIHCDFCHKIADIDNDRIGLTHGRYGLRLLRPARGQLFFGPLDDVDRHEDSYAPVYRDSRYCASCHEGTVFGVHVYGTYSEWLASPARREGKQCQTCHTAPTGKFANIAPGHGGLQRDSQTLANHVFFAGSQADMLRRAVRMSVTLTPRDHEVRVQAEVRNEGAGHSLPTGFVDRNVVLVIEGFDGRGRRLGALRGPRLPAAAGPDVAGQVGRLYAKLLKDAGGRSPVPFWQAGPEVVDTRLPPGHTDLVGGAFPASLARVRVRLLYRRFWPEVAAAKGWLDNEAPIIEQSWPAPFPGPRR